MAASLNAPTSLKSSTNLVLVPSKTSSVSQGQWPEYDGYEALQKLDQDIRLLNLKPLEDGGVVTCSLITARLDSELEFHTLSYYWGAPVPPDKLKVIVIEGVEVLVRPTLEMFLRKLISHTGPILVWLDAVCINQRDIEERNIQVAMMGRIYQSSKSTYAWLGESNADIDYACDYIQEQDETKVENTGMITSYLEQIVSRPYWRRLWVVQEFVLSQQIQVLVGDKLLDWNRFEAFVSAVLTSLQPLRPAETIAQEPYLDDNSQSRTSDQRLIESSFQQSIISNPAGKYDSSLLEIWKYYREITNARKSQSTAGMTLFDLMYRFRRYQCADERDKVYALLALADDKTIYPDYSLYTVELYFKILAITTPSCDPKLISKHGPDIFNTVLLEKIARQCIPLTQNYYRACFDAAKGHEFSQIFRVVGKISLVGRDGASPEDEPPQFAGLPEISDVARVSYTYLLERDEEVKRPPWEISFEGYLSELPWSGSTMQLAMKSGVDFKQTVGRATSVDDINISETFTKLFHVGRSPNAGDLVYSLGEKNSMLDNFIAVIREEEMVDIGIDSSFLMERITSYDAEQQLSIDEILLIRAIMLLGIRACKNNIHCRCDVTIGRNHISLRGTLFHIDRRVLTILAILHNDEQILRTRGDRKTSIVNLRNFLAACSTLEYGANPRSVLMKVPLVHRFPSFCASRLAETTSSKVYEYTSTMLDFLRTLYLPRVIGRTEFTNDKQLKGVRNAQDTEWRWNYKMQLSAWMKAGGIAPWWEWHRKWQGTPGLRDVLFSPVIEDHQIPGTEFTWDYSEQVEPPPGEIIYKRDTEPGFYIENMLLDLGSLAIGNRRVSSLRRCTGLEISGNAILKAKHKRYDEESEIDLGAFLCNDRGELRWVGVLLTTYNDIFITSRQGPGKAYKPLYKGRGPAFDQKHIIAGIISGDLANTAKKFRLPQSQDQPDKMRWSIFGKRPSNEPEVQDPHRPVIVEAELLQPGGGWLTRSIDLGQQIVWVQDYGLRFAYTMVYEDTDGQKIAQVCVL